MSTRALFHFDTDQPFADAIGHTVTQTGTPALTTAPGQFGDGVFQHDSGGYLSITHADMVVYSYEAYTIEARVWVASGTSGSEQAFWIATDDWHMKLGVYRYAADPYWYIIASNGGAGGLLSGTPIAIFDTAVHVAVTRDGSGNINFWVNGANHGTETSTPADTNSVLYIGAITTDHPIKFEEVRFTGGEELYTTAFSVPSAAFLPANPAPLVGEVISLSLLVAVGDIAAPSLPLLVASGDSGTATTSLSVSVLPAGYLLGTLSPCIGQGGSAARWTVAITIAALDVTPRVVRDIDIDAEEGMARIADFTIRPTNGTAIDLASWTGLPVTIDVADNSTGAPLYAQRLFTGYIDTTRLDIANRLLTFRCTDDLQGRCHALPNAALAALIGGYPSPTVFSSAARGWDFANDQLSTVPAALDISPLGQLRLTPWAAKETPDMEFDESMVGDGSLQVDIADRAGLVNEVTVEFDYRFPRVKAEMYSVGYTAVDLTGFAQYILDGNWFLQRAQVEAAIRASGASLVSIVYDALPTYIVAVGTGYFTPSAADLDVCMGFAATVTFDFSQTTEEQHRIRVYNALSIAAVGTHAETLSGALEGAYSDLLAVESGISIYKADITQTPPQDLATPILDATVSADVTLTTETDRAAADAAMAALIAIAKTRIAAAHRRNRVAATVPLIPAIDLDKTVRIAADHVAAQGKVARVTHRLSTDTGIATSTVRVAVSALDGVGTVHAEDPTTAPAGTAAGSTPLTVQPLVHYNAGPTDDHVITVTFPGVADAERANAIVNLPTSIAAPIDEDEFTITVEA